MNAKIAGCVLVLLSASLGSAWSNDPEPPRLPTVEVADEVGHGHRVVLLSSGCFAVQSHFALQSHALSTGAVPLAGGRNQGVTSLVHFKP